MLSSMVAPDVVHYPDTEKVSASDAEGQPIMLARRGPTLEYWEGEGVAAAFPAARRGMPHPWLASRS